MTIASCLTYAKGGHRRLHRRKAQTFIITMVFLSALIFAVQQLLFTYSTVNTKQAEKDAAPYLQASVASLIDSVLQEGRSCKISGCLSFDGRDDSVIMNSSLSLPPNPFSVLGWAAIDKTDGNSQIIWKEGSYGLSLLAATSRKYAVLGSKSIIDASDPSWAAGCVRKSCLNFDGENDYANFTAADGFGISNRLSIDVFVYLESDPAGRMAIVGYRPFSLFYADEGARRKTFGFTITSSDAERTIYAADNAAAKGQWQHITAIYNGTYMSIYVNGNISGTPDVMTGTISTSNSPLCIGAFCDQTGHMKGRIDVLSIFNRQLSSEEVKASGSSAPSSPALDLDFDEGFGQLAYDMSASAQPDTRKRLSFTLYTGSGPETIESPDTHLDTYTHVAGVYNGTSMLLYLDGTRAAEKQVAGIVTDASSNLTFGGQKSFAGRLDEVKIYSKALAEEEILNSMASTNPYEESLAGYWGLDEGIGRVALDYSPRDNAGILYNFGFTSSSGWRSLECARIASELNETEAFLRQLVLPGQAVEILYNGQPNSDINCSASSLNVTIRVTSRTSVFEKVMRY